MIRRTLILEATPPSLNALAGRGSRFAFARAKRQWQNDLGIALMQRAVPRGLARVEADAELRFPSRRRRDAVNFATLIDKAFGDALVEGGWLEDDTPEFFRFGGVEFASKTGTPRTWVRLRYWSDGDGERPTELAGSTAVHGGRQAHEEAPRG